MSLKQAKANIDDEELKSWMAYDRLQPIGLERQDYLNALLCYITSKPYLEKNTKIEIDDFIPKWNSTGEQTPQDMEQILTLFAKTHNKRVEKRA